MPASAEPLRHLDVENCGRFRAGSYHHASPWRVRDGFFGECLDADGERRRVRPGTRAGTRKGWTTRARRSAGSSASTTTCNGAPTGTASHGAPRRAGIPSPSHAAAPGHGTASGAAYRLSTATSGPPLRCTAAAGRTACGGAAARIPSGAGSAATSGHGTTAHAAYCRTLAPKRTAGRERAAGTATRDTFPSIRGTPRSRRPLAAARAATAIAKARRRKGATRAAADAAVAEPPA